MSNNASQVAATSKHDVLLKKREELRTITRGHKRKLREYLVVSQCDPVLNPIPVVSATLSFNDQTFLDNADITIGGRFQEESLPPRRQLRSHTIKFSAPTAVIDRIPQTPPPGAIATPKPPPETESLSGSRHATPAVPEQSVQAVASAEDDPMLEPDAAEQVVPNGLSRRGSRDSETDKASHRNGEHTAMEDAPCEPPMPTTLLDLAQVPEQSGELEDLESGGRGGAVGSERADSVRVAEEKAGPEDQRESPPPRPAEKDEVVRDEAAPDAGEDKLERKREQPSPTISLQIPRIHADAASSPESTSGPLSATTPALHEASTDTSPDNEAHQYDVGQPQRKLSDAESPTQPTSHQPPKEVAEAQIVVAEEEKAEAEVIADRPSSADAQLQLDAEQAAAAAEAAASNAEPEVDAVQVAETIQPDRKDTEMEQDSMEVEDEVMGVATSQDEASPKALPTPASTLEKGEEIPDSQESEQTDQITDAAAVAPQASLEESSREPPEKQSKTSKEPSPATPSSTPRRTPSVAPPEGMLTRVKSGTIRNRSVSEIIGEKESQTSSTPADSFSARKASASDSHSSKSTSRASTPQNPWMRSFVEKAKEKERSKLSTVIFAKQPTKRLSDDASALTSSTKPQASTSDDYLKPFFESQITEQLNYQPLAALIQSAHKTISTSDSLLPIQQIQMIKILRRVQFLQEKNQWSLRQPKRSVEPNRPTTHRDLLLQEMKWMRTDFREERKWKMAVGRNLARECALYQQAENLPTEQALLRVKLRRPTRPRDRKEQTVRKDCYPHLNIEINENEVEMVDANNHEDDPTPDLIPSGEESSPPEDFEDEVMDLRDAVAPAAIFTLADDDVVFSLRNSPTSEKLLEELPLYGAPLRVPQFVLPTSDHSPDAHWKRPILPLSKYADGQMVILDEGPLRKKSRYEYETEDDDDVIVFGERHATTKLPSENNDVALFNPENKHIRDRIHAGHQFRPPSEFPMPTQSFFESRESSQWTKEEEDELKRKVREYSYNWSLIASELQRGTAKSCGLYATVAERRTPWECFERWVSMEGLPQDMAKTTYFRAYTSRLATAERNLAQQQVAVPQPGSVSAAGALPPARRPKRSASAIRVDRRKNAKHLHLVDAMRKNAKKREQALNKQAMAATLAKQRKTTEQANAAARQPQPVHKPQDFSKIKHDREVAFRERVERYQQQQLVQRQAQMQQARQSQQQNPQLSALQLQAAQQQQLQRSNGAPNGNALPNGIPNSQNLAVPGQNRNPIQQPSGQMPNPAGLAPPMSANGIPQAQMQNMQHLQGMRGGGLQGNTLTPAQLVAARQLSEQQRMMAQQQHAQGSVVNGQGSMAHANNGNAQNSPPNMRNANMAMNMNMNMTMNQVPANQSMRPNFMGGAFSSPGAMSTPPASMGLPPPGLQQGSPRMPRQAMSQSQILHAIQTDIRVKNPNATTAELQQIFNQHVQRSQQNAMHAAAGGAGSPISGFNAGSPISGSIPHPMANGTAQNGNGGTGDNAGGSGNGIGNGMRGAPVANTSGMQPQMYANLLRTQQQQQQQQQQMQQQMQAQQQGQNGTGHGRSGSLSAQNQGGGQNGQGQNQQGQGNGNGLQGNMANSMKG